MPQNSTLTRPAPNRRPPLELAGYRPARDKGRNQYHHAAAEHAVQFFARVLRHVKGPRTGAPFILEPWQEKILRTLFGWRRPDGTRRYRRVYIEVPRKNGKSTFLAGIVLYCFACEQQSREGAQLYSAAATQEQAALVWNTAAAMIARSPQLSEIAKVNRSTHRIHRLAGGQITNTYYRALPAEQKTADGLDATVIVSDELHAWPNRDFYDILQTSVGARLEPLSVDITTAGYDRYSICWLQHQYAQRVRDGQVLDDAFLPVIYAAADDDDWLDPRVWRRANPNLGVSISLDYLEREAKRAQESVTYQNTFRRLHLNQWTSQDTRFLDMEFWRRCNDPLPDLAGAECYAGLDLSSTGDITAFVLLFPGDEGYYVLPRFWIPAGQAARIERADRVPYAQWAADGYVTATPGDRIEYEYVLAQILEDAKLYDLRQIGYDAWGAEAMRQALEREGLTCVQLRQGARTFSSPAKELERLVVSGQLAHADNPVLDWMAGNVAVRTDVNGNIQPVKPPHNHHARKIDGIVALIMALGLAILRPEDDDLDPDCFLTLDR